MEATAVSFFWIALVAVLAPLLAAAIPRRLLPEIVLLLAFGMIIGPHVLGLAEAGGAIELVRELGLGMLFLLAGYEVNVSELTGSGGRRALVTWIVCFALALVLVVGLSRVGLVSNDFAIAIALTSTSLGTLLPILKDSGLLGTRFGAAVLNHGAFGELGPIVAMAVLLGTRGAVGSLVVLAGFGLVVIAIGFIATRSRPGSGVHSLVQVGADTTAQTVVRLVVLLLATLGLAALAFGLDLVLGAFAAGFVLRRVIPEGAPSLEHRLEGMAFGLLIPIFFVTSGMGIDPRAVAERPFVLVGFVVVILLVRGGPIYVASRLQRQADTSTPVFSPRESLRIALYGATGLPIIVAVTEVAVRNGHMAEDSAALLVAGGAITVLLLPMVASLLGPRAPAPTQHQPAMPMNRA